MKETRHQAALTLLLALLALGPLTGCEEDVVAVLGTGRAYTLYGVISPRADTQWVRVFPIEPVLLPAEPTPLGAVLTSVNQGTGETHAWQDSLIQEANGQYAHVYWSAFRAEYGQTYTLSAVREDGASTTVDADVPEEANVRWGSEGPQIPVFLNVFVQGEVPNLLKLQVLYVVEYTTMAGDSADALVALDYDATQSRVEGGWTLSIPVLQDLRRVRNRLLRDTAINPLLSVDLVSLTLTFIAANEAWAPPGNAFDPEVLVQPGTMSNVLNGFGFVGAGYRVSETWVPDIERDGP